MSGGKIVGIILSAIIGFLLIFLLMQEGSSTQQASTQTVVEEIKKEPVALPKTQEEEKLEELKKEATSTNNSVSNLYSLRCKACHGSEGQGTLVGPSIKGKEMSYILGKLDDYKNNRVTNSLMQGLLNNATQEELNALAQEISSFK